MKRLRDFFKWLAGYIKENRWSIVTLVISMVMIMTIGRNALHSVVITAQIAELESECEHYRSEIKRDSSILERLKDDDELMRYARERYYMRRKGEDLFIYEGL